MKKLKVHQAKDDQDIVAGIIELLEKDTGKKVFTVKVLGDTEGNEYAIDILVVFTDESILMGHLIAQKIQGKLGIRVQGDFI